MKKIIGILLVVALVAAILPSTVYAKSPKTEFDLNGPHFNLNLIAKKAGWNDKEVSNPDRHTMFVPMDTSGYNITLNLPNKVVNHGAKVGDNVTHLDGFGIFMTQSGADDFAVIDGTAFDGTPCALDLAAGKYKVVVVAKGKPTSQNATIDGWAQVHNTTGLYYYLNLGEVSVGRKWVDATDLFFIDIEEASYGETGLPDPPVNLDGFGMWIFDYFEYLDSVGGYGDYAYFWQLQNNNSKLIQVRFYPYN
jgi:hypothetical protein